MNKILTQKSRTIKYKKNKIKFIFNKENQQ